VWRDGGEGPLHDGFKALTDRRPRPKLVEHASCCVSDSPTWRFRLECIVMYAGCSKILVQLILLDSVIDASSKYMATTLDYDGLS